MSEFVARKRAWDNNFCADGVEFRIDQIMSALYYALRDEFRPDAGPSRVTRFLRLEAESPDEEGDDEGEE